MRRTAAALLAALCCATAAADYDWAVADRGSPLGSALAVLKREDVKLAGAGYVGGLVTGLVARKLVLSVAKVGLLVYGLAHLPMALRRVGFDDLADDVRQRTKPFAAFERDAGRAARRYAGRISAPRLDVPPEWEWGRERLTASAAFAAGLATGLL